MTWIILILTTIVSSRRESHGYSDRSGHRVGTGTGRPGQARAWHREREKKKGNKSIKAIRVNCLLPSDFLTRSMHQTRERKTHDGEPNESRNSKCHSARVSRRD